MTPVITVEPYTPALARAHELARGVAHGHDAPACQYGQPVITERCNGLVTVLSGEADCPFGIDAAARAWAEASGATYAEAAA